MLDVIFCYLFLNLWEGLRPGVGHRILHPGLSSVRAGLHHPDLKQGVRGMGRASRRHRHCLGYPGPAAAPQPRAQHPGRKLPAPREAPGWTLQLAAPARQHSRGFRQPLSGLMESLSIIRWVNSKSAMVSATRKTGTGWVNSPSAKQGQFSVGVDIRNNRKSHGIATCGIFQLLPACAYPRRTRTVPVGWFQLIPCQSAIPRTGCQDS